MSDTTPNGMTNWKDGLCPDHLRGNLYAGKCPSRTVLNHVSSRWGVLVLISLLDGTHRFSDLRRRIGGVSEKMLAQTLKWLEGDGFVERHAYPEVPPRVEYTLTPLGTEVAERVYALKDWIETNLYRIPSVNGENTPADNEADTSEV